MYIQWNGLTQTATQFHILIAILNLIERKSFPIIFIFGNTLLSRGDQQGRMRGVFFCLLFKSELYGE